jgi:type VI protein secretion system component Hcp
MLIFLEIKGPDLPGESKYTGFENQIEVESFSFETIAHGLLSKEKGSLKKRDALPIKVVKPVDKTTPKLMQYLIKADPFDSVTITCAHPNDTPRPGGGTSLKYVEFWQIKLNKPRLVGYANKTSKEDGTAMDEITFDTYESAEYKYTPDEGKGNFCTAWDVTTNTCR